MELVVGFEPTRAEPAAYKTAPIDLYGTPACYCYMLYIELWSEWRGSNPRPHGPKPRALSAELHPDINNEWYESSLIISYGPFSRSRTLCGSAFRPPCQLTKPVVN